MVVNRVMDPHFEEDDDQEWPEEEEMGATSNKQHDITAPGMSEITSVPEFKEMCAALAPHLEQLQSPIPPQDRQHRSVSKQAQKMGIPREQLKDIQKLCE